MPPDHWPVRLPTWPVHVPGVDVDDVDPVLFSQSGRNLRSDRLAYQRPNRGPDRSNTEPLPSDLIDHHRTVVPVAVDVDRCGIHYKDGVLGLDRGKLVGRRLQHCWMAYDNDFRLDRAVAGEESGSAAPYLLADARINGRDPGHQWTVQVD